MVKSSCFVFNNIAYNLVTALVPPSHLSNDTDLELVRYCVKADGMKRLPRYNENGERRCSSCKEYMVVVNFHKDSTIHDGLAQRCKDCMRKYQYENMDKIVAKQYEWQKANADKVKAYTRKYQETHKETLKQRALAHYHKRGESKPQYSRDWRARNREKSRKYASEYLKTHPDVGATRAENRRALKLGNGGTFTTKEWQQLKEHYSFTCLCCGRKEPEIALTRDHVLPLAMGGRNVIENLQPLCKTCNSKKHTKHIDYRPQWRSR